MRIYNLLVFLSLTILGVVQMVGYLSGNTKLWTTGFSLAASPMPYVFSRVGDVEAFSSKYTVTATFNDDSQSTVELTPELYSTLSGPTSRVAPYIQTILLAPAFSDGIKKSILGFGFCNTGSMTRSFGFDKPVKGLDFKIKSFKGMGLYSGEYHLDCSP